jgi:hypothetical protein
MIEMVLILYYILKGMKKKYYVSIMNINLLYYGLHCKHKVFVLWTTL